MVDSLNEIIYKFIPIERLTYLEDELLRITQPAELNDPFEFLPAIPSIEDFTEVLKQEYQERIALIDKSKISRREKRELKSDQLSELKTHIRKLTKNESDNLKSFFLERAKKNLNSNLGVLSLTRRWDSTLMWSHYTNSHRGLCIGFNSCDPFFSNYTQIADREKIFMPVTYRDNRIKVPIQQGVSIDFQVVLSKSKDWEYEEEERLLVKLGQATKVIPASPYDICLFKVPHPLVEEIVLGVNFPEDKMDMIRSFCSKRSVDLYKCKISETEYDMEREILSI